EPVRRHDEEEERAKERKVLERVLAADRGDEVRESLREELDGVLESRRTLAHVARREERDPGEQRDDDRHGEMSVGVADGADAEELLAGRRRDVEIRRVLEAVREEEVHLRASSPSGPHPRRPPFAALSRGSPTPSVCLPRARAQSKARSDSRPRSA